ncbi:MAG: alginate export family protein [Mangrovibacterium sp.]
MNRTLFLFFLLCFSSSLWAQEDKTSNFSMSAEVRPRYELRDGYKAPLTEEQDLGQFISNRVRLNMNYNKGPLAASLRFQDVGTWGDRTVFGSGDTHKIGFFEAWASYRFAPKFALKVGRQVISYDDERIMGEINWSQQGLSHDALVMQFNNAAGDVRVDIGASYNQESEKNANSAYPYTNKAMQYLWINQSDDSFYWSFLFLNNGTQQAASEDLKVYYSKTYGVYLNNVKKSNWDVGGSLYAQGGKDVFGNKIAAFYVAAHLKKALSSSFKLGIGAEVLSGTDMDATDTKNHSFDPIYGTNHKFNGFMDYFYVGNHKNNVGLQDYYTQLDYKKNKFSASLVGHVFSSMGNVVNESGDKLDNYLGVELDLTANYQVDTNFKISGGYSRMFASESMQAIKGAAAGMRSGGNWLFISLDFTPQFFSISK